MEPVYTYSAAAIRALELGRADVAQVYAVLYSYHQDARITESEIKEHCLNITLRG